MKETLAEKKLQLNDARLRMATLPTPATGTLQITYKC
jgi:hypothetical protein